MEGAQRETRKKVRCEGYETTATLLTDDECSKLISRHNLILHFPTGPCICVLGSYCPRPHDLCVLLHREEVGRLIKHWRIIGLVHHCSRREEGGREGGGGRERGGRERGRERGRETERIGGRCDCRRLHHTLTNQRCCTTSTLTLTSYRDLYSGGPVLGEGSITVHGCHSQVVLLYQLSIEGNSRLYLPSGTIDEETLGGWGEGGERRRRERRGSGRRREEEA